MTFLGPQPKEAMPRLYADSDVFLFTSIWAEPFGRVLIEAMALGVPVIGGLNSGAVPWVLNYGKNGLLVDIKDENEICNAVIKLIEDPIQYEKLSSGGISHVAENFSVESVCNKYIQLFKEILS